MSRDFYEKPSPSKPKWSENDGMNENSTPFWVPSISENEAHSKSSILGTEF